jgi:hypothetical protein
LDPSIAVLGVVTHVVVVPTVAVLMVVEAELGSVAAVLRYSAVMVWDPEVAGTQ